MRRDKLIYSALFISLVGAIWLVIGQIKRTVEANPALGWWWLPLIALLAYFIIKLDTLLHELGHLLGGWWSGYRLVSFQLGKITLQRQQGKLILSRDPWAKGDGQCLMDPPAYDEGN